MTKVIEPTGITPESANYLADLARAFHWYNREKDKKDARLYLKNHLGREKGKVIDSVPDSAIIMTYGWIARLKANGCLFRDKEEQKFQKYLETLLSFKVEKQVEPVEAPARPNIRENMEDKIQEYLGEMEGVLDEILFEKKEFNLYKDMQGKSIPAQYCPQIGEWVKRKAGEFIAVYESKDSQVKEAYSNLSKKTISSLLKTFSEWLQDLDRYAQYKKANRKPRAKKAKPAGAQVSKLKFKKQDDQLKIKSVNPVELVGASQVWIYNTKYKKLAVYRSDSASGIQVKGTTLQNYDPEQSEQKTIRKPQETLKKVLDGSKVQLRKILTDVASASSKVNGRVNEECIIVRVIK